MSAQSDDVQERITQQIKENPVILYMKGCLLYTSPSPRDS